MLKRSSEVSCGVEQLYELAKASSALQAGRPYNKWQAEHNKLDAAVDNAKYGTPAFDKASDAFDLHYDKEPKYGGIGLDKGMTYIFSDADKFGNGKKLYTYIKKNKLGKVVSTGPVKNPESGNIIRTWLWTYNGK